ncbi:MAG TPA: isocitrate/isopropylmalate family dehydrogenase, partial [Nitrospiria bacterium]|nr:isocitrate/isopropylmalate family dehydrogenase [Nitrospiria bacterium]
MKSFRVAVFPGDGIGQEVVPQGMEILSAVGRRFGHVFEFQEGIVGGAAIDRFGKPLP